LVARGHSELQPVAIVPVHSSELIVSTIKIRREY
jgi:hypothetical protein